MPVPTDIVWKRADLVALDLEGSGAQDREDEAILEIAVVPLDDGNPDPTNAYSTLINPGRKIRRGPWISPGLTNAALAQAPELAAVEPQLAHRLTGKVLVGHNIAVDWRLLSRRCQSIRPTALIDTLRLARHRLPDAESRGLANLIDQLGLRSHVDRLAPHSQPHRALWDAIATGLLLTVLIATHEREPTIGDLLAAASVPIGSEQPQRLF